MEEQAIPQHSAQACAESSAFLRDHYTRDPYVGSPKASLRNPLFELTSHRLSRSPGVCSHSVAR